MTEEEAKTKWCPFGRVVAGQPDGDVDVKVDSQSPVFNRVAIPGARVNLPAATRCIGSACMAWRWGSHITEATSVVTGATKTIEWTPASKKYGYCGLVGKP